MRRGRPASPRTRRYRFQSLLGRGATCEVWAARRTLSFGLGRALAIKRPLPGLASDRTFLDALVAEARLAMALRHPGIVRTIAIERRGGECLVVMERVDGGSLRALLRAHAELGRPEPGLGAYVVRALCRALAHAHARGIVHRDVSPANVLLARDGGVKLGDFGVARAIDRIADEATRTRSVRGTLAYMAPEQLAGAPVDGRADLFAAGVVLYEALTGRRLFKGATVAEMAALREAPAPPPSSLAPDVPAALDAVCARAMARDPAARFSDAAAMAAALDPIVSALGFGAAELAATLARAHARAAPRTLTQGPRRRVRVRVAAAAAVALLGLALGGAASLRARPAAAPPPAAPSEAKAPRVTPPSRASTPVAAPVTPPAPAPHLAPPRRAAKPPARAARPGPRAPDLARARQVVDPFADPE